MAIVFFDGFGGGAPSPKSEWRGTATVTPGLGRDGGACLTSNNNTVAIPASAMVTVGCAAFGTVIGYIQIKGDAGATSHLTLRYTPSGPIELLRGTITGTVIATAAGTTWAPSEWRSLMIQATIADSGGRCIVKRDGVTLIDFTGDTKNAGTSTLIDAGTFTSSSVGSANRWSDLWVCDGVDATATQGRPNNSFLGDLRVATLLPNGVGATTQWTPSGAGANWQQVSEVTPNTTNYVSTATPGNRDLYALADLPPTAKTVYAVQLGAYAAKSDAGAAGIKPVIRTSDGTVTAGDTNPLSTTWTGYAGQLRAVKPDGSLWSVADVNGLQAGVEATA